MAQARFSGVHHSFDALIEDERAREVAYVILAKRIVGCLDRGLSLEITVK